MNVPLAPVVVKPADAHNARLLSNVHPLDWQNPTPASCYNLVVIGAGTAGLVTAAGGGGRGWGGGGRVEGRVGGGCCSLGGRGPQSHIPPRAPAVAAQEAKTLPRGGGQPP